MIPSTSRSVARGNNRDSVARLRISKAAEAALWNSPPEVEEKPSSQPEHYVEGQFHFLDLYNRLQEDRSESTQHIAVHNPKHDLPYNLQQAIPPATRALDWTGFIVPNFNKFLGSGGFGDVFEGYWNLKAFGLHVQPPRIVVKSFRGSPSEQGGKRARVRLIREIAVWHVLKHENIVPFVGICHHLGDYPGLISEYMSNGSVKDYISRTPSVCLLAIILGILRGLRYLHNWKPRIIHGNLATNNVLINKRGSPCLCDFGLSRILDDNTVWNTSATPVRGNLRWQAPELLFGAENTADMASDVYAYGMTCYEVITGRVPFDKYSTDGRFLLAAAKNEKLERPNSTCIRDSLWDLLKSCWSYEPSERPTTSQILNSLGSHTCGNNNNKYGCLFRDIVPNTQDDE